MNRSEKELVGKVFRAFAGSQLETCKSYALVPGNKATDEPQKVKGRRTTTTTTTRTTRKRTKKKTSKVEKTQCIGRRNETDQGIGW